MLEYVQLIGAFLATLQSTNTNNLYFNITLLRKFNNRARHSSS